MSTVKISQLPEITHLNTNTDDTLIVGVDTLTTTTGKITVTTLAEGLYSNNALKVGSNQVQGANVIAQFTGNSTIFLQTVVQNFDGNGSSDMVATASDGDDTSRYVDLGINGKDFSDTAYSAMKPYDAYLYNVGYQQNSYTGNLVIGTASTGANIVFIVGGTTATNIVGRVSTSGYDLYRGLRVYGDFKILNGGQLVFADATTQSTAAAPENYTQSAFDKANTTSANTIITQGVDAWQNTNITAVNGYATSAYNQANTNAVTAQNAYNKANNALANTSGTFNGNLNINGYITVNTAGGIYQDTASPSIMVANTSGSFAIVTRRGTNPNIWSFNESGILTTPGDLNVTGNLTANYITANNVGNLSEVTIQVGNTYWSFYANNTLYSTGNIWVGNVYSYKVTASNNAVIGSLSISNNAIYSTNTAQDMVIGQTAATANLIINRTANFVKDITANGAIVVNNNGLIQYTTSNNSTVTQSTSKSTAVTCNGRTGQITTNNASLAGGRSITFTVNNNQIVSNKDMVIVNIASGAAADTYSITTTAVTPGSFNITINNISGTAQADTLVINFAILRVQ